MYSTSTVFGGRGTEDGMERHRAGKHPYFFIEKMDSSGERNKIFSCQNHSLLQSLETFQTETQNYCCCGVGFSQHIISSRFPASLGGTRAHRWGWSQYGLQCYALRRQPGMRSEVYFTVQPAYGPWNQDGSLHPRTQIQPKVAAPGRSSLHGMCDWLPRLSYLSCIQLRNETAPTRQGGLSLQPKFASLQYYGQDRTSEAATHEAEPAELETLTNAILDFCHLAVLPSFA